MYLAVGELPGRAPSRRGPRARRGGGGGGVRERLVRLLRREQLAVENITTITNAIAIADTGRIFLFPHSIMKRLFW